MNGILIPAMAVLNRFRGGGFGAAVLPGHPRFYVTPVLAVMLWWLFGSVSDAIVAAISYLVWSFLPWGHLIGLGRWNPTRKVSRIEEKALFLARGNVWIALGIVELVGLGFTAGAVSRWALLMPPFMVGAYELGWRLRPRAPIELAELLIGVIWAVVLLIALSGCAPRTDWGALAGGVKQVERNP